MHFRELGWTNMALLLLPCRFNFLYLFIAINSADDTFKLIGESKAVKIVLVYIQQT